MRHYEAEVFRLGVWENFEDMESKITLNELLELYASMRRSELRELKMHLKAQGAEVEVFDEPDDGLGPPATFDDIMNRVKSRSGEEEQTTGGSPFGPGLGFKQT